MQNSSIIIWKMLPALFKTITKTVHCLVPRGVDMQVMYQCSTFRWTCWKPSFMSSTDHTLCLPCFWIMSLIRGNGWTSVMVTSFMARKSTTNWYFIAFFYVPEKRGCSMGSSNIPISNVLSTCLLILNRSLDFPIKFEKYTISQGWHLV